MSQHFINGARVWHVHIESTCTEQNLLDAGAHKVKVFYPGAGTAVVTSKDPLFKDKLDAGEGFTGVISAYDPEDLPDKGKCPLPEPAIKTEQNAAPATSFGKTGYEDYSGYSDNYQWYLQAIGATTPNHTPPAAPTAPTWQLNYAADDPLEGSEVNICVGGNGLPCYTTGDPNNPGSTFTLHPSFHWYNGINADSELDPVTNPTGYAKLTEAWGSIHADGGVLAWDCIAEFDEQSQPAQGELFAKYPDDNTSTGTNWLGVLCSDAIGSSEVTGSALTTKEPTFSGNLGGTWDGSSLVLMPDTSGVLVDDFIVQSISQTQFFKIIAINPNVSVTVDAGGGYRPPTGDDVYKITNSPVYNDTTDMWEGFVKGRIRGLAPLSKVTCLRMGAGDRFVRESDVMPLAVQRAIAFNAHILVLPEGYAYNRTDAGYEWSKEVERLFVQLKNAGILTIVSTTYGGFDFDKGKFPNLLDFYYSQSESALLVGAIAPRDYDPYTGGGDTGLDAYTPTPGTPKGTQYNLDRQIMVDIDLKKFGMNFHFLDAYGSFGPRLDIVAPGGSCLANYPGGLWYPNPAWWGPATPANNAIYSTSIGDGMFQIFPGTWGAYGDRLGPHGVWFGKQEATAMVAGVAALAQEANYRKTATYLTAKVLKGKIKTTAEDRVGPETDSFFLGLVPEGQVGHYKKLLNGTQYPNMEIVWDGTIGTPGGPQPYQGQLVIFGYSLFGAQFTGQISLIAVNDEPMDIPGKDKFQGWGRLGAKALIDNVLA